MKITIDCDNLSTMQIHHLKEAIADVLLGDAYRIKQDLLNWPDSNSPTYKEMKGWELAAMDEYHSVLEQFRT